MTVLPLDLLGGLPEGWIPVDVVSVVKCLDNDGEAQLAVRQSGGLSTWEAIGMMRAAEHMALKSLEGSFEEGDDAD